MLGYVYDPGARAIRSISGVPGSAAFEQTLVSDLDLTFVSPTGDYAVSHGLEALRLLRRSGQNLSETAASGMPDQIAFSPSGKVVAIYYQGSGTIEVWAGLPDTPKAAFRNRMVLITSDGERLISGGDFTAVAFLRGSPDAVAADSALDQVLMSRNMALASVQAGPGGDQRFGTPGVGQPDRDHAACKSAFM